MTQEPARPAGGKPTGGVLQTRASTWPMYLASVWLIVVALAPWVSIDAVRVWDLWHTPALILVPSGGIQDMTAFPGITDQILPVLSLLTFLTLLALPALAAVTFGLGAACVGQSGSRSGIVWLALSSFLVAVVPWAIVIRQSRSNVPPASGTAQTITLLLLIALSASVPGVAYTVIGPLAHRTGQPLPAAEVYPDPGRPGRT